MKYRLYKFPRKCDRYPGRVLDENKLRRLVKDGVAMKVVETESDGRVLILMYEDDAPIKDYDTLDNTEKYEGSVDSVIGCKDVTEEFIYEELYSNDHRASLIEMFITCARALRFIVMDGDYLTKSKDTDNSLKSFLANWDEDDEKNLRNIYTIKLTKDEFVTEIHKVLNILNNGYVSYYTLLGEGCSTRRFYPIFQWDILENLLERIKGYKDFTIEKSWEGELHQILQAIVNSLIMCPEFKVPFRDKDLFLQQLWNGRIINSDRDSNQEKFPMASMTGGEMEMYIQSNSFLDTVRVWHRFFKLVGDVIWLINNRIIDPSGVKGDRKYDFGLCMEITKLRDASNFMACFFSYVKNYLHDYFDETVKENGLALDALLKEFPWFDYESVGEKCPSDIVVPCYE